MDGDPALVRLAHLAVARALRSGVLVRQPCERCGDAASEAHHEDYTKPLDITWLCKPHHKDRHKALRLIGRSPGFARTKTFSPEVGVLHNYLRAERGRLSRLAEAIGVSPSAIRQWSRVPPERAHSIAAATGLSCHILRPDIWPNP